MAITIRIIAIGNSAGIILPKEILDRLKLQKGDTICLSETPFGAHIIACDGRSMRKLESTEKIALGYREALRRLAE